ncbi:hypothetical protein GCM10009804_55740 [Kribbella hippodromi]|uniref:Uncharacterized protein n=1 Tax=Kribbella hippodromi TaxID=434347 RepID=A0ABN2E1V2_9ACTN
MLELWGAVLDRSLESIAAASADARAFDRTLIVRVSDVWDNNTFPFVHAAVARGSRQAVLAEAGFRWMADFGTERRDWVLEQAAACGRSLSLPPVSRTEGGRRGYDGKVHAPQEPLTPEVAVALATDYDLASTRVRHLVVERSADGLRAALLLAADRRFEIDQDDAGPAELDLRFDGVEELRFDSSNSLGTTIADQLTIGPTGVLRATHATSWIHDSWWHHSTAGHAADAATPPNPTVRRAATLPGPAARRAGRAGGRLADAGLLAAIVLHRAMLDVRAVRYPSLADEMPVHKIARAFAGSGAAMIAAGGLRVRRQAAFRRLIEHWIAAGGDELAPYLRETMTEFAADEHLRRGVRDLARALCPEPVPEAKAVQGSPEGGEVVLVEYRAATEHHRAELVVQQAVAVAGTWVLRGTTVESPGNVAVEVRGGRLTVAI